jgi:hypothetical protein
MPGEPSFSAAQLRWTRLGRAARLARLAALAASAWAALACVYVMLARAGYRGELEWMTGSILDHVERVRAGEPVYTAPDARWIPFLYPPLYYRLAAAISRAVPIALACRGLSIAATFAQAACVARLARRLGADRFWTAIAVGAFFAAFRELDYWYDLERPDSLVVAMLLAGAVVLVDVSGVIGAAIAGFVVGAAFFAKQPALLFLAAGAGALVVRRERARAVTFAVTGAGVVATGALVLQRATVGWFSYYVWTMPRAHGVGWGLLPDFVVKDLPLAWLFVAATAFFVLRWCRRRDRDDAVFVTFLAAAFVASASSRIHVGGWANVLMFWTSFAAVAIGVAGARLEALARAAVDPRRRAGAVLVPLAVALQVATLAYRPSRLVPTAADGARFDAVAAAIRDLERDGEVVVFGHGHLTTPAHFHIASLIDVVTVEGRVPDEVARPFRDRRFAAIVLDSPDDLAIPLHPEADEALFPVVVARYAVARRLDAAPVPVVGWPARPTWVLLPRPVPLDEHDRPMLHQRMHDEMAAASAASP